MIKIQKKKKLSLKLNEFLKNIKLKKQYLTMLKKKVCFLMDIKEKNDKNFSIGIFNYAEQDLSVAFIIHITFSRINTYIHVMDSLGNLKFFYSAGSVNYVGKRKRSRFAVMRDFYRLLGSSDILKNQPVALQLINVGFAKTRIIKLFKKKFFVKVVRDFTLYPYNGCRKKKVRRKKVRKKNK